MIKLSPKDSKFKKSTEFRNEKYNFVSLAHAFETTDTGTKSNHSGNERSLEEKVLSVLNWDNFSSNISDYVYNRIKVFQQEKKTTKEITDWLRLLSREIELSPYDMRFKDSGEHRVQIESAAKALEHQQTSDTDPEIGEKRSALDVLFDSMIGSSESDKLKRKIQLASQLSEYIVNRINWFDKYEHYSFKELAQWLRLFLAK